MATREMQRCCDKRSSNKIITGGTNVEVCKMTGTVKQNKAKKAMSMTKEKTQPVNGT